VRQWRLFGWRHVDGNGAEVRLQHCLGVEYAQNYLWVADSLNHKLSGLIHAVKLWLEMVHLVSKTIQAQVPVFLNPLVSVRYRFPTCILYFQLTLAIRRVDLDMLTVTTLQFFRDCAPQMYVFLPEVTVLAICKT